MLIRVLKITKGMDVIELFQNGFPNYLRDDVSKVVKLIPLKTYSNCIIGTSEYSIQYFQDSDVIKFPYRMYYIDFPTETLSKLSPQQQMILHCIYTRSCDGFVRQQHLQSLLLMDYDAWVIPYIISLCDEYVIEILEMTYDIIKQKDTEQIKKFCLENIKSFCKSYDRMVSYWNEYYRRDCKNFHEYVGRKLFVECFGYSISLKRNLII